MDDYKLATPNTVRASLYGYFKHTLHFPTVLEPILWGLNCGTAPNTGTFGISLKAAEISPAQPCLPVQGIDATARRSRQAKGTTFKSRVKAPAYLGNFVVPIRRVEAYMLVLGFC